MLAEHPGPEKSQWGPEDTKNVSSSLYKLDQTGYLVNLKITTDEVNKGRNWS